MRGKLRSRWETRCACSLLPLYQSTKGMHCVGSAFYFGDGLVRVSQPSSPAFADEAKLAGFRCWFESPLTYLLSHRVLKIITSRRHWPSERFLQPISATASTIGSLSIPLMVSHLYSQTVLLMATRP